MLVVLDESRVWSHVLTELKLNQSNPTVKVAHYAVTEMLNNAIDHGHGQEVELEVWISDAEIAFRVTDDGEGVFAHLRAELQLVRDVDAAGELTKGKVTTARDRHTGEGILFTSKAAGIFRISANGLRMTIDSERGDVALGISRRRQLGRSGWGSLPGTL